MALGFSKKNRTKQGKELESPKNQKENPFSTKNPFSKDTNSKTKATLKFVGVLLFITFTTQFMTAGRPNPVTAFALEYGPKKQVEMQIKNTPQATLDSLETHLEQLFIGDNKKEIENFENDVKNLNIFKEYLRFDFDTTKLSKRKIVDFIFNDFPVTLRLYNIKENRENVLDPRNVEKEGKIDCDTGSYILSLLLKEYGINSHIVVTKINDEINHAFLIIELDGKFEVYDIQAVIAQNLSEVTIINSIDKELRKKNQMISPEGMEELNQMFADTMQAIKDREMELAKSESSMIMTSRMYARYIIEKDKKYEDEVTKRANEILHDSSYSRIDGHSRLIQHKLKQQTSNPVQGKYKSDKRTRHK